MATGSYLSIIIVNINGLNAPTFESESTRRKRQKETQRVPNSINTKQNTLRHILIKLTKIKHKEQILKAKREEQQKTQTGISIRITADLSLETFQPRREWQDIL